MAESKTTAQEKTAANKRQEAVVEDQKEQAEKSARTGKAIDSGTLTLVLRDDADSTVDSIKKLAAEQGATVKSARGLKITVELPEGSERQTGALRQKVVEHMLGSPLVEDVE